MRSLLNIRAVPGPLATGVLIALFGTAMNSPATPQNGNPTVDPQKIVHDASWNELHSKSPGRSFRYRQHKVDPKGTTVKEIFETKDGDVARLLEKDGKPLDPGAEQGQVAR